MKTRRSLPQLTHWILRHALHRRRDVARLVWAPSAPLVSGIAFPLIDFHNTLATFLRVYCLSSLSGAYTADGRRVQATPAIRGHRSALAFAIHTAGRPKKSGHRTLQHRHEPTWHDPNAIIRILRAANCSNADGVSGALSIGSRAIDHLTTTRNFLAHRNERTALKLRRLAPYYGIRAPRDPVAVLFASGYGRPQRIVEDWIDDIFTIFSLFPR